MTIAAAPSDVWAIVESFADIAEWHPMVGAGSGEGENETGATRNLTLEGGEIVERLDKHQPDEMSYSYRMLKENVQALPVSFYSATLKVEAAQEGSKVSWMGRFYRGDTGNTPPENLNDEAGKKAMSAYFRAGLDSLRSMAEAD
ncbi:SRPBCC family protein [Paracoccus alkanivorans]|uniref:SRPBCC family protein n=1 Tax=Paracoccus alkanivorans TaxID=2116655 RepID=UPI00140D6716|nr:SRPBCC family protein [Paracoccus alkanivorans]